MITTANFFYKSSVCEQQKQKNKGFSLAALIIVIAIMAVLAGIPAPQLLKYIKHAKYAKTSIYIDGRPGGGASSADIDKAALFLVLSLCNTDNCAEDSIRTQVQKNNDCHQHNATAKLIN